MSYTIIWTKEAERTFDKNIEYLQQDWNQAVIIDFIDRVAEVLDSIRLNTLLFPLHKSSDSTRRCVVTEQVILFYKQINSTTIELQIFWNVYQNPKRLKL